MKLLERQPDAVRDAPPEPPVEAPPEDAPPEPELRTCKSCGATMEPGQDWCLACGTAAGRRGGRPGVRSMSAVLGLTGLLLAGAVAASYAALSGDQTIPPTQTAPPSQVAPTPPPPATTPPGATHPAAAGRDPAADGAHHARRDDDHRQEHASEGAGAVRHLTDSGPAARDAVAPARDAAARDPGAGAAVERLVGLERLVRLIRVVGLRLLGLRLLGLRHEHLDDTGAERTGRDRPRRRRRVPLRPAPAGARRRR